MAAKISETAWDTLKSPYASRLHTNYVPSMEELPKLEIFLAGPKQELSHLESKILRLQDSLTDLYAQRDRAKSYIEAHRALMSPIRRFPAETLAEIFTHCLSTDKYPSRSLEEAPLLLMSICRSWRHVAVSSPQLWKALHISFPTEMTADEFTLREQGSIQWLKRSGSLPFSLSLAVGTDNWSQSVFRSFFWMYRHRIAEIVLILDRSCEFSSLQQFFTKELPALTALSIHSRTPTAGGSIFPNVRLHEFTSCLSKSAPLKKLCLFDLPIITMEEFWRLGCNWNHLTVLALGIQKTTADGHVVAYIRPVDLLAILAQTPRLQSCHALVEIDDTAITSNEPVELHHLHTLSIIFKMRGARPPDNGLSAIRAFSFSSLQILSITLNRLGITLTSVSGVIFSAPMEKLQQLRLEVTMSPADLTECLLLTPNLTVLEIIDVGCWISPCYPNTMQDFHLRLRADEALKSEDKTIPFLCPHLTTFRLFTLRPDSRGEGVSNKALLDFLKRKCSLSERLKICDVLLPPNVQPFSETDLQQLRELQLDGLQLFIRYLVKPLDRYSSFLKEQKIALERGLPNFESLASWEQVCSGTDSELAYRWSEYGTSALEL